MPKAHKEYRSSIKPKIQKILSDIERLTKFSLSKEYDLDDVKQINEAIRKSSQKMLKTLTNNLEEEDNFEFLSDEKVENKTQESRKSVEANDSTTSLEEQ